MLHICICRIIWSGNLNITWLNNHFNKAEPFPFFFFFLQISIQCEYFAAKSLFASRSVPVLKLHLWRWQKQATPQLQQLLFAKVNFPWPFYIAMNLSAMPMLAISNEPWQLLPSLSPLAHHCSFHCLTLTWLIFFQWLNDFFANSIQQSGPGQVKDVLDCLTANNFVCSSVSTMWKLICQINTNASWI